MMSLTLGEVKENAEYNLNELPNIPLAKLIGERQLHNYDLLIKAGETDDSDFDEAVERHPELKLR
jgi:hypothetical protein